MNIDVLISEQDIKKRLKEIASEINEEYKGKELTLICILKGSVYIACELSKYIDISVTLDFMSVSSYGNGTESTGRVKIVKDLDESVTGKNVLLVEDIIDSGRTIAFLKRMLEARNPESIKICTLLDKPSRRVPEGNVKVDYVGFEVPDKFVVGYGLDYAQLYRNLPYIGVVNL